MPFFQQLISKSATSRTQSYFSAVIFRRIASVQPGIPGTSSQFFNSTRFWWNVDKIRNNFLSSPPLARGMAYSQERVPLFCDRYTCRAWQDIKRIKNSTPQIKCKNFSFSYSWFHEKVLFFFFMSSRAFKLISINSCQFDCRIHYKPHKKIRFQSQIWTICLVHAKFPENQNSNRTSDMTPQ